MADMPLAGVCPGGGIPAGAVVTAFVDFLISFGILVAMMLWFQYRPGWQILTLPLFIVIAFLAALAAALSLDGTATGIARAQSLVAQAANRWNFGTAAFANTAVTFAASPSRNCRPSCAVMGLGFTAFP